MEALRLSTEARIETDIEALRKDTKVDIAEAKSNFVKWMFGAIFAYTTILVALLGFFVGLPGS